MNQHNQEFWYGVIDDIQLTEGERTVLSELVEIDKKVQAISLAEKLNERPERVVSILNSLAEKSLIELEIQEIESYELTDEGLAYATEGLPELRLFEAVRKSGGSAEMDAAVSAAGLSEETKGIAISWCRKNGWLSISKREGRTILTVEKDETHSQVQELLELLKDGEPGIEESLLDGLVQAQTRTLVETSTEKVFLASLAIEESKAKSLIGPESGGILNLTPEMLASGQWRGREFKPYNMEIIPPPANVGRKHPYAEFVDWLKEELIGLGFTEWWGPFVETEFWNNDVLFVPQDHVARDVQDQFRVDEPYSHGKIPDEKHFEQVKAVHEDGGKTGSTGWEAKFSREIATRLCLRAHTTPVSMRYLASHYEPPHKMFIIDRNFRSETLSATHAQEFDQCEGIIWDEGLTLRDLMGYIREICRSVGIKKLKFKPGQFPFTEPSVEGYAKHETLGWIEVAPGGIFRPEVTHPLGIKETVLAWGLGASRMYMAAMDIDDIRNVFSRDLTYIRRKYFAR